MGHPASRDQGEARRPNCPPGQCRAVLLSLRSIRKLDRESCIRNGPATSCHAPHAELLLSRQGCRVAGVALRTSKAAVYSSHFGNGFRGYCEFLLDFSVAIQK